MDFDVVIEKGSVVDGSGNPWFRANIGIKEGRIAEISRLPFKDTAETIDAKGLVVCPGFIDLHSHSDFSIMIHNRAESSLHTGLTTMGVGQCGSDAYTLTKESKSIVSRAIANFSRVPVEQVEVDWLNLGEWRERLEVKGIGANIAPYVGFGNLRRCIMGVEGEGGERYEPTEVELDEMKGMLENQMGHGAFGMSTGLRYSEQRNAYTEEVIELAKVVAKYGGIYISHMRGEADVLIESCKELIEICEEAGIPGCYSHHKAMFPENWGKPSETMRLIDRARARDIEIYCDQYCQLYAREVNLGTWFMRHDMAENESKKPPSVDDLIEDLKDNEKWEELKKRAKESFTQDVEKNEERKRVLGERGVKVPNIWNPATFDFIVYSKTRPDLTGMNFTKAAEAMGIENFWDAIRELYIADDGNTYVAAGGMCEEDIITILKHPTSSVSTDDRSMDWAPSLRSTGLLPHPRGYGVYAKVLGRYVRDIKILGIEEAVRKMTSLPAQFLGLKYRGMIREGYWADIVLFDPETVEDRSTFEKPVTYPLGIPYVLVNGQVVISKGKHTGQLPGIILFPKA